MKKKLLIIVLLVIVMGIVLGFIYKKETDYKKTDAYKFKVEYESYNGAKNTAGDNFYRSIEINKNNKMVYSTAGEIVEKIEKKESFVVYFGFGNCPWCRTMIENLIDVSNSYDQEVYYVNILHIRDKIEFIDGEKTITKGDEDYMKLIDLMGDVLDEYLVLDNDGNEYDTNEKRIYAPNVVAVVQGKATKKVEGISKEVNDPYMDLTEEMKEESIKQLDCIFKCLEETGVCTKKGAC